MKNPLSGRASAIQSKLIELAHQQLDPLRTQLGSIQCATIARTATCIRDAEFKVFSQWGEDGAIEYVVQRITDIPRTFVEFGVEDYSESNTRFLLINRHWRGLIIDGGSQHIKFARRKLGWRHPVTAVSQFITTENINRILAEHGFDKNLGILSVDIDGNDYWIWETIQTRAWLVICEYNAVLGNRTTISVPYQSNFSRMAQHYSGLYYGASLGAIAHLANRKGYDLIGTNRAGNNAFFIRRDVMGSLQGSSVESCFTDSTFAESRDSSGTLTYLTGRDRSREIGHMPVVDVCTGEVMTVCEALARCGEAP